MRYLVSAFLFVRQSDFVLDPPLKQTKVMEGQEGVNWELGFAISLIYWEKWEWTLGTRFVN